MNSRLLIGWVVGVIWMQGVGASFAAGTARHEVKAGEPAQTHAEVDSKRPATKPKYGPEAVPLSLSHGYFKKQDAPQFWALIPYYVPQQTGGSCSVASVTMLINAARAGQKLDAEDRLASETQIFKKLNQSDWQTSVSSLGHGVTLDQLRPYLEATLKAYGLERAQVEVVHAEKDSQSSRARIHQILVQMARNPKHLVLANFLQGVYTGDAEVGHFAPVGAYDPAKKRVLILDPDREWYEPYWVSEDIFFQGMATLDPSAGSTSRGLIQVTLPR
jgi:hypothetical protein